MRYLICIINSKMPCHTPVMVLKKNLVSTGNQAENSRHITMQKMWKTIWTVLEIKAVKIRAVQNSMHAFSSKGGKLHMVDLLKNCETIFWQAFHFHHVCWKEYFAKIKCCEKVGRNLSRNVG